MATFTSNHYFAILSQYQILKANYLQFSEYLKSCREYNHLTQEQLTSDLYIYDIDSFKGLETTTISKWERGVTKPKASKQASIIKYFQQKTGTALPCWENYTMKETEKLICKVGMHNLIGKSKKLIFDFPSDMMSIDGIKIYPLRNSNIIDSFIDTNMPLHQSYNHKFAQINREQFKEWALHPDSLFLACQYNESFMGLFFTIKVKPNTFNEVLDFEMKKSEIKVDDFASSDEMGSSLMLSFFAMNEKIATMLLVRYYAYLIANQRSIVEIGIVTIQDEAKEIVSNMNLQYDTRKITDDGTEIQSYRQTLFNVMASEKVVKILLSKQECPEE